MITHFKKRANREFARKIDESRARFETTVSSSEQRQQKAQSNEGEPIREGDHVYTQYRGGRHEGDGEVRGRLHSPAPLPPIEQVEEVVSSHEEADEAGVKNPPKVLFTDQRGKHVAHNPETLNNMSKK